LRDREAEVPLNEPLYRTVEADWIDGDRVLGLAIDGEGTSCARSAHANVEQTLKAATATRPAENGLVSITASVLPSGFTACNGVSYDVFAYDHPVEGNEAHCEIRWRRTSDRPSTEHLKKVRGAAKDELKAAIADHMLIVVAPKPIA
jgi:hypothetical protein